MFFLLLTGMIICFVAGTALLIKGEMVFGFIGLGVGILLLLFIVVFYGKRKYRKKKKYACDCLPDFPDCDCDLMPDCDCGPNCD